jgi:hypothetical protein
LAKVYGVLFLSIQGPPGIYAAWAAASSANPHVRNAAYGAARQASSTGLRRAGVVAVLRDIFGNPFRPVSLARSWLTPTVANLAATAYEERALPSGELDRTRLAVLADALEEAGCTDATILDHLRGPGPHVRGCWALDAILGRQ